MNRRWPLAAFLAPLGTASDQETECPIGTQSNGYQVLPTTSAFTSMKLPRVRVDLLGEPPNAR